jgi:enamine deaminase RidA (YjgF/YER057c/UK114 family)
MSSIVGHAAPGTGYRRRRARERWSARNHAMSPHRIVNATELGEPRGFSHAVVGTGTAVYLAGQIGSGASFAEQFDTAAGNLLIALRAAGGKPEDLVSLQVFVTDVGAYKAARNDLGPVWRKHFGRHYPAMGMFGVTELFEPDALVELMGVAVLPA